MNDQPEMFAASEIAMESPRLAWMKKHNAVTFKSVVEPMCWFAGFSEKPLADKEDRAQWMFEELGANGNSRIGEAETEDEALAEAARIWGIPLWNETP